MAGRLQDKTTNNAHCNEQQHSVVDNKLTNKTNKREREQNSGTSRDRERERENEKRTCDFKQHTCMYVAPKTWLFAKQRNSVT